MTNNGTAVSSASRLNTSLPVATNWGDLGFDPVNDHLVSSSAVTAQVVTLNPVTGATVATFALPAGSGSQGSQDAAGNIYLVGTNIQQINPLTGAKIGAAVNLTTDGTTPMAPSNDSGGWTPPTGTIGDRVFWDNNNNGTFDATVDKGIANVTVQIYTDNNNDGVVNGSDTLLATDTTDANGQYHFNGVLPGNYIVKVNDANAVLTGRTYSTAGGATNAGADVTLIGGQILNINFGLVNSVLAGNDSFSTVHDTAAVINVNANDSDPQGDAYNITAVNGSLINAGGSGVTVTGGNVTLDATGKLTYTPNAGYAGSPTFTYTVTDSRGATATATVLGTVIDIAPVVDLNSGLALQERLTNGNFSSGATGWTVGGSWGTGGGLASIFADTGTHTLTQAGIVGWDNGSAQVSLDAKWTQGSPVPSSTAGILEIVVGGTVYAKIDTGAGNNATATVTYLNGASGNLTTLGVGVTSNWVIALPNGMPASADFVIRFTGNGAPGDDMYVDNVSAKTLSDAVAGNNYATTYKENTTAVSIAAAAATVRDSDDTNTQSATITLTNPQTNDRLLVGGSAAASGTIGTIAWTRTDTQVTLTGSATKAEYAAAIQAIQFENTGDLPSTVAASSTPRTINVTVNDGILGSNTAVATINVDLAPDPVNDAFSVAENIATSGNVLTNDTDVGTTPTIANPLSIVTGPTHGALTSFNTATGAFVYTPTAGYIGTDSFVYKYTDANGDSATATVTLTVTNTPPVAVADTFTTGHDTPVTIDVLANDSDPNGDVFKITQVNGTPILANGPGVSVTGGTVTLVSGKLVFAPAANYAGTPSFTYTITDVNGGTATATVNGTVLDTPPIIDLNGDNGTIASAAITSSTATTATGTIADGTASGNWTLTRTAQNGFTNTVSFTGGPNGIEAKNNSQLGNTLANTDSFAYTYSVAPAAGSNVDFVVIQRVSSTTTGQSENEDFTVTWSGNGSAVVKDPNHQFANVTDGQLIASGTVLQFRPNAAGVIANTGNTWRIEVPATSVSVQVVGVDGSQVALGDVLYDEWIAFNAQLNTRDYAATYKENGAPVSIAAASTFVLDNDNTNMMSASITLTNPQTGDRLLVNGATTTTGTIGSITWIRTDTQIILSGSATKADYAAAIQAIQFENTGDLPSNVAASSTPRLINVTVNDGILRSNTAVATINIDLAPDPVNDAYATNEDTTLVVAAATGVLANDTDMGTGPTIANPISVIAGPTHGALSAFNTATGAFTYIPTANYNGTDTFTYRVTDANGDTKDATVTITVNPVNDPPVNTVPGPQSMTEDGSLAITGVTVSDVDGAGVPLTTTLSVPPGAGILRLASTVGVTVSGDGSGIVTVTGTAAAINAAMATITYTPTADFNTGSPASPIALTVSTSDGIAPAVASTIAITVTPVVDIANDAISTNEDTPVTFNPFANDTFENPVHTITAINGSAISAGGPGVVIPSVGTVTLDAIGNLTFTPVANYNGTPSFTYTVSSGGVLETATVNMTVVAVNDAPTNTLPSAVVATEDTNKIITGVSVADIDSTTLTTTLSLPAGAGNISVVTGGSATISGNNSGTVTISGTAAQINAAIASITYVPAADFNTGSPASPVNLTVATSDGSLTTTGTVSLTVTPVADITNDTITGTEDTTSTFNVLTGTGGATTDNFESAAAFVSSVTQPANGTVTFAANGAISYKPSANFNGADTFTYTVTSGGVTETATVTINVAAVNDAPVNSVPGAQTTAEDTSLVFSAANGNSITVSDVDSNVTTTLSVANGKLSLGSLSGVTVTGDGTGMVKIVGSPAAVTAALEGLKFAPAADWNGTTTLNVSTTDGIAPAVASTVSIITTPVADVTPDAAVVAEDTAATINVLANDSFANTGATVSAVTQPTHGTVTIGTGGNVTYTPATNYNGTDSFTYTVTSGGVTETTTVTMTVTPVNDAPAAGIIAPKTSTDGAVVSYGVGALFSDVDGDKLTFSATNLPVGLSIDPATGTISGTIDGHASQGGASGVYPISVTAKDPSGAMVTQTFNLSVTNPAPVAVADAYAGNEDTAITGNVTANDSDPDGDALTVDTTPVVAPAHGKLALNADGSFTYTPDANYNGTDNFTYTLRDADGATTTAVVTLTIKPVNDAPLAIVPPAQTTAEDAGLVFNATNGNAITVVDVDGDTLTTTLSVANGNLSLGSLTGVTVTGNGTGSVTLIGSPTAINAALNGLTFAPVADWNGATSIAMTTSDGIASVVSNSIDITVKPVADITPDAQITPEDTARTFNVLANDSFESAGAIVSAVSQPAHGTVSIGTAGNVTYTPDANYNGADSFTYTVTSGGVTETTTVTMTVTPVNDAPTAAVVPAQSSKDGSTPAVNVAGYFSDIDGDNLTFSANGLPTGLSLDSNGNVVGTIASSASQNAPGGVFDVAITATDPSGATVIQHFNWTVSNPPPVAAPDAFSGDEGTTLTGNVKINDSDPDGDATTVDATPVTGPAHGTLVLNANGTFAYTPDPFYNGPDSFTYTLRDADGATSTATVSLTVNPVNDNPSQSVPPTQTVTEDMPFIFSGPSGNAIVIKDVDSTVLTTTLKVSSGNLTLGSTYGLTVTGDGSGTVVLTGSPAAITGALEGLMYKAAPDFNGSSTLSISTTDGIGTTNSAVAMTVTPVADITPDTVTTLEDNAISFNVLTGTNGATADTFSDPAAAVTAVSQGAHGTVAIGADGVVTYTPAANYNGSDTFSYTVTSGGVTETTTVTVNITPVNDAPVATALPVQNSVDHAPVTLSTASYFSDVDGDTLTYTATGLPTGLSIDPATGQIIGTIDSSASQNAPGGVFDVAVTAKDPTGATVVQHFNWTVTNPAPVAVADVFSGGEDTPITGNVITNDSDPDGDALSVDTVPVAAPAHGTLVLKPDGSFKYTPDANYNGPDSFTYTLKDANGATTTATVSLTVNPVNDAPTVAAPVTQTVGEDTPLTFSSANGNAISIGDIDSPNVTTTLTASHGTVTVGAVHPGVTVGVDASGNVTLSGSPAAITAALDGLTFKGAPDYNGPASLVISTDDGALTTSATVAVTVTPVADITPDTVTTAEDTAISFDVLTGTNGATADTFSDPAAALTAVTQGAHGAVAVGTGGLLTYTPAANFNGTDTFTYTVTSGGVTETTTVTVNVTAVNDPPTQIVPSAQAATEDTVLVFSAAKGNAITVADVDGNVLTTTISVPSGTLSALSATPGVTITGNGSGSVTLIGDAAAINAALSGLTYTPVADANGPVTLSISTSDGTAAPVASTIDVSIAPVADIVADTAVTNEDVPAVIDVLANDTFENAGHTVSGVTNGSHGTVAINTDGTLTYTPDTNFNGTDSFTYTVTSGGATETTTVSVTVTPVNDAPVATTPAAQTGAEDTPIVFSAANGNAISVADVDSPSLTTTISSTNGVLHLASTAGVTATGDGSGNIILTGSPAAIDAALNGLSFAPAADYNGAAAITVTTSDGPLSDSKTIALTIAPVADIVNDTITTAEDTPATLNLLANDSFADPAAAISAVTQPAHGHVTVGSNGQVTYSPDANYNGADSFTYTVSSGGTTETATVSINVTPVNDPPVTSLPGGQVTAEDTPVVFSPANGNAITLADVDGDVLSTTLSVTNGKLGLDPASLAAAHGLTITGDDTSIITIKGSPADITLALAAMTFTPTADYNGAAVMSVTTSDGTVTTSATVGITIQPVADITADHVSTSEGTPITFNVLTGTNGATADTFESPSAAVTSITQGASGTVSFLADGAMVYTPNALFHGTDTFTYTVTSGGVTETATVTVDVAHVNHAPTTTGLADRISLDGQAVSVNAAASFADVDSTDTLTYAVTVLDMNGATVPLASLGLVLDPATGLISGSLDKNASQLGPYQFTVAASDGLAAPVSSSFTWTVANPAPTANHDTATTNEDTPATINVLGNDTDPDHDPLMVVPGSATAGNGAVVINNDGTISYTPNLNFNGSDTIVYQISDGNGGFSTATVTVTVVPVNDAPTTTGLSDLIDSHGYLLTPIDISSAFSDVDHDALTFSVDPATLPPGVTMDSHGVLSGTPTTDGTYPITITASDGHGGTVDSTFSWKIVNIPPAAGDDVATTPEDMPIVISVLANDADPQGDPIHITTINGVDINTAPGNTVATAHGSITLGTDAFGTQVLIYTPDANFNGTEMIVYGIADNNTGVDTAVINITVTPVNDAPTADPLPHLISLDGAVLDPAVNPIDLAPFFHDIDTATNGDTLTFSAIGLPKGLTMSAAGQISGTIDHNASQAGPYVVVVQATDAAGAKVTQTFTWDITNPAPTAVDDAATAAPGATVTKDALHGVMANDTDPDHDPLTVAKINGQAANVGASVAGSHGGTFTVNADGSYTFVAGHDFDSLPATASQTTTVSYTISDGNGGYSVATLSITVDGVNLAPVASAIPAVVTTDSAPVTVNAAAAFTDTNNDPLTFTVDPASVDALPTGLSLSPSGLITGTIDSSASQHGADPLHPGVYHVTILADDGQGGVTPVTIDFAITNPAPIANNDTGTGTEDNNITGSVATNDSDPDGDHLSYAVETQPTNGTVTVLANGTYTYVPKLNFHGSDSFTYTVTDADGATSTATVSLTVTPVNDAPVAATIAAQPVKDGDVVSIPTGAAFSDVDGDALTYSATVLDKNGQTVTLASLGLTIDTASGLIAGTIDHLASANGPYSLTVVATDPSLATATQTFALDVTNPAPVASALANTSGLDGSTVSIPTATAFHDPDGDALTYSVSGLPAGFTIDATGVISGTWLSSASTGGPANDGVYHVTVTATDSQSALVTSTFDYKVTNPAPIAKPDNFFVTEDTPTALLSVATNDVDPDADALTYAVTTDPAHGTLTFHPDGTFTYAPVANYNGSDSFTYTVTDANGATSTATVSLTVTPVNDAPGPNAATITTPEDTPLTGTLPTTDVDGDPVTVALTGNPTNGSVLVNPDGTYTYTPVANFNGPDAFTVQLSDGRGGLTSMVVTVNVTPVNDAPIAVDDHISDNEDTVIHGDVTPGTPGQDSDAEGDPITVVDADGNAANGITPVVAPAHGKVVLNADGTFDYTPDANYNGTDIFVYRVSDGNGGFAQATVYLTVAPQPDAAVIAGTDTGTVKEDVALTASGTLSIIDPDFGQASFLSQTNIAGAHGTFSVDGAGSWTYVLNNADPAVQALAEGAYLPSETFTVTSVDGTPHTVTVAIVGTNDAPVTTVDTAGASKDAVLPATGNVLTNDTDKDAGTVLHVTQIDGTPVTEPTVLVGTYGTLTINPDGSYSYLVNTGNPLVSALAPTQTLTDTFTYTASDGIAEMPGTLNVTIAGSNTAPTGNPDHATTPEDTPIVIDVLTNDTDAEGNSLHVAGIPTALHGVVIVDAAGQLHYTPNANYNGADTITYTVADPGGLTSTTTVAVTVTPVNDAPVAKAPISTTLEDTPVSAAVTATDVDGDALTFTKASDPAHGTVTVHPDGTYTYTPATNYNGTDSFQVTVNDGHGGIVTITVPVVIRAVNDAPVPAAPPATTLEDTPVTGVVTATDAEGDPLTFTKAADPAHGTVTINSDGTYTYTPALNYNGADSFQVKVSDGHGGTSLVTVVVNITPVNDAPVAANDTATTTQDKSVKINVLGNDQDVENDPLTVIVATADHGTVTINADGTLTFAPTPGFAGNATITYKVSDGHGGFATAKVDVVVKETPVVAPTAPAQDAPTKPGVTSVPTVTEPVIDAVNKSGDLGSLLAGISKEGVVIATVQRAQDLGSITPYGANPNSGVVANALPTERLQYLNTHLSKVGGGSSTVVEGLEGFSLRMNSTPVLGGSGTGGQLILESMVRDQTLLVQISNTYGISGRSVSEYRVMQADGRPLPDWLERVGTGLLMGKRPANSEVVQLRVIAILKDGTSETREVTIQTNSGELKQLADKHAERQKLFSDHLKSTAMLSREQTHGLGRAVGQLQRLARR